MIQSHGNALMICGPDTGHVVTPIAFCDTPARAAMLAQCMRIAEANSSLASAILGLLGNVDGDGPNSASARGEMLNAIRTLAQSVLDGRS